MLHYETINPSTLELLKKLQGVEALSQTRLVGGTALALQFGHRVSVDLDLFGSRDISEQELTPLLSESFDVKLIHQWGSVLQYVINDVKVDFVDYRGKYNWIDSMVEEDGIRLASTKDIAAMKIAAITNRGKKKDFIDLFFLLKQYSLKEIIGFYFEKYPDGTLFNVVQSLSYFGDAEEDEMPKMFVETDWEDVKKTIAAETKLFAQIN